MSKNLKFLSDVLERIDEEKKKLEIENTVSSIKDVLKGIAIVENLLKEDTELEGAILTSYDTSLQGTYTVKIKTERITK